ncbi:unnamed protein product [Nyctereutes procyonoides]|uniref:(raccoon dog) hypothetical protein n=1 Tax=Nyctereutes procyonoides TaxID=34880 RepID=A0A811ZZ24_NYCPR|nr:unnamed protein product [Nyctereutes procyonoides]
MTRGAQLAPGLLFSLTCRNGLIVEEGQYVHNIPYKITNRKYPKLEEVVMCLVEQLRTCYKCCRAQCGHCWRDCGQAGPSVSTSVYLIPHGGFPKPGM